MIRVAIVLAVLAGTAHANVERYAVIIGDNAGAGDEQQLRFAEADAMRVAEVLGELGGVRDENQVVLRGKSADLVRRALIATNERIRVGLRAGHEAELFVYYSGHGDADALHLGDSRFELRELEALVRGSPAQVRVLVIDACRAGSLTRVKGGTPAPAIALSDADEPAGEGMIVLTASTAGEDAQESDQLGGSFFTHYLVSALRGAADDNGDHIVTVGEAFRYTREQTVAASSRTLGGTQHPTFYYDLRGRTDVVLADLARGTARGQLTVPDGATWLVLRAGGVVGEIPVGAARRTLSLAPGRYVVRGRERVALVEGPVSVAPGSVTVVDPAQLDRIAYARLVRKGRSDAPATANGLFVGPAFDVPNINGPCVGGTIGANHVRADLTLSPRLSYCSAQDVLDNDDPVDAEVTAALRVARVWDLRRASLDIGVGLGAMFLQRSSAPRGGTDFSGRFVWGEWALGAAVDVGIGVTVPVARRGFLLVEAAQQNLVYTEPRHDGHEARFTAKPSLRTLLAIGLWL